MQETTPLDADLPFDASEDERPAGQWLEGYWTQMAYWAKRITWSLWAYLAIFVYSNLWLIEFMDDNMMAIIINLAFSLFLWALPLGLLSYFTYTFSHLLEAAPQTGETHRVEKAWKRLRQMLWTGMVIVVMLLVSTGATMYYTYRISQTQNMNMEEVIPLQSEGEEGETMEYDEEQGE
ncbi:MAG: hypothetical protein SFV22_04935 [Saprospiraceae bacterium]|nr:hypothetical protein [Saprospiraceae bacterium]